MRNVLLWLNFLLLSWVVSIYAGDKEPTMQGACVKAETIDLEGAK